jgi:alpha-tubulin suppressor-like RCC1 family protein
MDRQRWRKRESRLAHSLMYSAHPRTVPSAGISVAAVATGGSHTCVVASGGGLWCWGANGDGQLGINSTIDQSMPAAVSLGAGGQDAVLLAALTMLPQHLYYACAFDAAVSCCQQPC